MPVKITALQKDFFAGDMNLAEYWTATTKLAAPDYCSALRCIERKISYCKVKRNDVGGTFIIPLCDTHSVPGTVSEIYDYHLAPMPSELKEKD